MNRLVRIALTMFLSATIMFFLVAHRAKKGRDLQSASPGNAATMVIVQKELQMAWVGLLIATGLTCGGVALLATAYVRSRKKPAATSDHG